MMAAQSLESPLGNKLRAFGDWTDAELAILGSFSARRRRFCPHQTLIHEHDAADDAYLVHSGWTYTYKMLPDGGRQIIGFPLPGDIVGLSNLALEGSAFSFASLTETEVSPISSGALMRALSIESKVARAMLWSAARESAVTMEHLTNIGRRSALSRTAHLILELAHRLRQIGVDTTGGFACPLNQHLFADALSLTAIHLNRVLRQLREADIVVLRSGRVVIHDYDGLMELAAFDPGYLSPPKRRVL
jgi:CRP-like cAMP-binding protein